MGSELVESSTPLGGGNPSYSFTQLFWDILPQYIVMGMSLEEFWNGDPKLAEVYRNAYDLKKKLKNENMWLQGVYMYQALCSASPMFALSPQDPYPYLQEPFPTSKEEARKQREEAERQRYEEQKAKMRAYAEAINNSRKEVE